MNPRWDLLRICLIAVFLIGIAPADWSIAGSTQVPTPPPPDPGSGFPQRDAPPTSKKTVSEARPHEQLPALDLVFFELKPGETELLTVTYDVDLNKHNPDFFKSLGAEEVDWTLKSDLLVELELVDFVKTDESRLPIRLTMKGSNAPHEIEVMQTPGKLSLKNPGKLTFSIPRPFDLRSRVGPGFFRGELVLKLTNKAKFPNGGTVPILLKVPIEVVITGHRLIRFDLLNQQNGRSALSVGHPVTATVVVETIGIPELGSGRVHLQFVPEGGSERNPVTLVDVPVPLPTGTGGKTPVEVDVSIPASPVIKGKSLEGVDDQARLGRFMVWDPIDARNGWLCHPRWRDEGIITTWPAKEPMPMTRPDLSRSKHQINLVLPDLFEPGTLTGTVWWNPPPHDVNGVKIERSLSKTPIRVGSGLWISPRTAARGENVKIKAVVSKQDAPNVGNWQEIFLNRKGADGTSITLKSESRPVDGSESFDFTGEFQPDSLDTILLEVSHPEDARSLKPPQIHVPFQYSMNLPTDRALVLFKDSPPFYWWIYGLKDDDGTYKSLDRERAMRLTPSGKDVFLYSSGIFTFDSGNKTAGVRFGPGEDLPRVWFADPALLKSLELPNDDWFPNDQAIDKKADDNHPRQWRIQRETTKSLTLRADISKNIESDKLKNGSKVLVARWLVAGVDENDRPYARIIQRPFGLEVSTQWVHYFSPRGALTAIAVLITFAVAIWLIVFIFKGIKTPGNRQPRRVIREAAGGLEIVGGGGFDDDPLGSSTPTTGSDSTDRTRLDTDRTTSNLDDLDPFGGSTANAGAVDPFD